MTVKSLLTVMKTNTETLKKDCSVSTGIKKGRTVLIHMYQLMLLKKKPHKNSGWKRPLEVQQSSSKQGRLQTDCSEPGPNKF